MEETRTCTHCGETKPVSEFYESQGHTHFCKRCRSIETRELKERRKVQGLCVRCGAPAIPGMTTCSQHAERNRSLGRQHHTKWRESGLCVRCGKRPPREGKVHCQECADDIARIHQEQRRRCVEYLGGKCMDCGLQTDQLIVYDFHHVRDKDANVSKLLQYKWERIVKELNKCVLVCANCHRIRHWGAEEVGD